jgi:hypothetical protein
MVKFWIYKHTQFLLRLSWNLHCDTEVPFYESKRMSVLLTRKQWADLKIIEFWKEIKCYEICISQIRRKQMKMVQARFDWACSWNLPENAIFLRIPSTGLSGFNIQIGKRRKFEFRNVCRWVHTVVIMKFLMWHYRAIHWKAVYGSKVK